MKYLIVMVLLFIISCGIVPDGKLSYDECIQL